MNKGLGNNVAVRNARNGSKIDLVIVKNLNRKIALRNSGARYIGRFSYKHRICENFFEQITVFDIK